MTETETTFEGQEFKTAGVATISVAHAVHDTYSAFLPPLLPLLIEKFTLTNTTAGLLSVFYQLPSLLQPFIGWMADRVNLRWLMPSLTALYTMPIAMNYKVNHSEKSVLSTLRRPLDVQYVDQFCYSDMVVDYFQNHWSVSPECAPKQPTN